MSRASIAPSAARLMPVTSQFSMMSTPNASAARAISPGNRVVTRGTAAPLQGGAQHRIANVALDVQRRTEFLGLFRLEPFVVDAVAAIGMHVAFGNLDVVHRVREHHHATRREHDVVIQYLREVFPKLQRVIVKRGAFVEEVIRADDGGVAPGVAAADPSLLEHGDVRQTVFFREVVGGAQPVSAAADDDRIVACLGGSLAPLLVPAAVARQAAPEQRQCGECASLRL